MFRISARNIVLFSATCFLGLVVLQFIWIRSAYEGEKALLAKEKKQFEIAIQNAFERNYRFSDSLKRFLENHDPSQTLRAEDQNWVISNYKLAIDSVLHEKTFRINIKNFGIVRFNHSKVSETQIPVVALSKEQNISRREFDRAGKLCLHCVLKLSEAEHQNYKYQIIIIYSPDAKLIYSRLGLLTGMSLALLILLGLLFARILKKYRQEKGLSQAKNDFINNLSHEIQTPVFAIQIANKLISEKSRTEEIRPLTNIIEKETAQLKEHATKILELASIENGQVELMKEKVDLNSFIEKKIPTLELMLRERKGSLEVDFAQAPAITAIDPVHFNNILVSLADNAIKYNDRIPKIVLRTFEDKDSVGVVVSDNGIGVAKEDLPFVFDKFYRVPQTGRNRSTGFGLGLNYVSEVVRLHNGHVSFTSEQGSGSAVKISLPKIARNA